MDALADVSTVAGRSVFGEPVVKDGVTVVPVANVRAGTVGREGDGGPAGVDARAAGAFVIRGEEVTWMPALDLNRIIVLGEVVGIVFLLTLRSIVRMHSRR